MIVHFIHSIHLVSSRVISPDSLVCESVFTVQSASLLQLMLFPGALISSQAADSQLCSNIISSAVRRSERWLHSLIPRLRKHQASLSLVKDSFPQIMLFHRAARVFSWCDSVLAMRFERSRPCAFLPLVFVNCFQFYCDVSLQRSVFLSESQVLMLFHKHFRCSEVVSRRPRHPLTHIGLVL